MLFVELALIDHRPNLGFGVSAWEKDAEDARDQELGISAKNRQGLGSANR